MRFRRLFPDALIAFVAVLATAVYAAFGQGGFPLDDSWIHQTYARNLAQTGVWSFVPGVPSAASTSPLYTVLLAAGYVLNIPFLLWTHALGAAALASMGIIGRRLADAAFPRYRGIGLACGLAIVLSWHLVWAAASGMETAVFSALTMACIALGWRAGRQPQDSARSLAGQAAALGIVGGLMTLARPEGVLLLGITGLSIAAAWPAGRFRSLAAFGVLALLACGLVLVPYLTFNLAQTGGLLPDTAAAKQAYAEPIRALGLGWGVRQMTLPLLAGGQVLLIPGFVVLVAFVGRRLGADRDALRLLPALVWGPALVLLYAWWLPLNFQHGRYVIPALPAFIWCGAAGTVMLVAAARRALLPRLLSRVLALSAAIVFVIMLLTLGLSAYVLDVNVIQQEMVDPARWIAGNIPADELLAVHDIGAVGYFAPRPIVDIAGLVTPEIVPLIGNAEAMWAFIQERGAVWLMALPDQLPGAATADDRLCLAYQSNGQAAFMAGGEKMSIWRIAWDGDCPA
jgi:hypothetical protein